MKSNFPALFSLPIYDGIKLYPPFSSGISLTNFWPVRCCYAMVVLTF